MKKLNKLLKTEEKLTQARMRKKRLAKEQGLAKPKQLSKHAFEEPELDLKLTEELTGSLRSLKPEGSLLADRFKSLQKRNLIETRVKAKIVKNGKKRKRVEKRSYKMHFDKKE